MRKTPYRIIIHDKVEVNPNYMERIDPLTIVSYISKLEYDTQSVNNILFFKCPYSGATGPIDTLWLKDGFNKSNLNIVNRVQRQIDSFTEGTYRAPRLILLHPETYYELMSESMFSPIAITKGCFYGTPVKRSPDVKIEDIELY